MTLKVLVVDDEEKIANLIQAYLENAGFQVLIAADGEAAIDLIDNSNPDLIILDLMLPRISGEEICEYVRQYSDVPILMLTAKSEEDSRVAGLELGADDYITKPFSPRELVARVKAIFRRMKLLDNDRFLSDNGKIVLNAGTHIVTVSDKPISLTPTEFRLLGIFLKNKTKVFSRGELAERLFGMDYDSYEDTIYVHVKNLRQKLEPFGVDRYIKTVYGVGYRWEENDET